MSDLVHHDYDVGFEHGIEVAMELLLGERIYNGSPFQGKLPKDVKKWAQAEHESREHEMLPSMRRRLASVR